MSSGLGLHVKAIMVDGRALLIGSMNLDPRSRLSNTEVAVLIDSPVIGAQLGRWFDDTTSPEARFRPELSEPLASWWQHAAAGLLGVLVPEDML